MVLDGDGDADALADADANGSGVLDADALGLGNTLCGVEFGRPVARTPEDITLMVVTINNRAPNMTAAPA